MRSLALADRRFDLVIFDPPYEQTADLVASTVESLPTICGQDARIVLEVSTRHRAIIEQAARGWDAQVETERAYGDTVVAVLRLDGRDAPDPGADVVADDSGD